MGFSDVMFVTFSIWAFLFESIEQKEQKDHVPERKVCGLHTTICKRLDLDILIWKYFIEDQF